MPKLIKEIFDLEKGGALVYLKRLEVQGFKSFADKMEFHFTPGVTIVVGPNGSGKSNIADSIRWVMGEQSAKSLRGAKMEDIIFSGSDKRRPVGMAEVSMTFDNTAGLFSLEYSEVTVTRRVFRSGESEYLINKVPCRLRDIHELFMDTGIGKATYSIISQGKVEEILSAKPEERRVLIEEAAGIVKYRNRKNEAMGKLTDTEQNLLRVSDIINELENQMGPLGEQAEKAEAYNRFKEELTSLEINLFINQLEEQKVKLAEARQAVQEYLRQTEGAETAVTRLESQVEELRLALNQKDEEISRFQQEFYQLSTEAERTESRIGLTGEQARNMEQLVQRLGQETEEIQQRLDGLEGEFAGEKDKLNQVQAGVVAGEERLAREEAALEERNQGLVAGEQAVEGFKSDVIDLLNGMAAKRNQLHNFELEESNMGRRLQQLQESSAGAGAERAALGSKLDETREGVEGLHREMEDIQTQGLALKEQGLALEGQQGENRAAQNRTKDELHRSGSRLKVLQDMQQEYEGYQKGVKEVLLAGKKGLCSGLCGVVAELINVPAKYEMAVEVALGGALQNIITETDQDAKKAIQHLKKNNLGRATFLPLNTIRLNTLYGNDAKAAEMVGALGIASQLIEVEDKYRPIIDNLLGRLVVVENIDLAVKIAQASNYRVKLVTLDGDVINPGGSLTGGSYSKKGANLLGRSREIEDLTKKVASLETQLAGAQEQEEQLARHLGEIGTKLTGLQEQYQQSQVQLATKETELVQLEQEAKRHLQTAELLEMEQQQLMEQLTQNRSNRDKCQLELAALEQNNKEVEEKILREQGALRETIEKRNGLNEAITQLKVELASLKQEEQGLHQVLSRYHQNRQEYRTSLGAKEKETAELVAKQEQLRQEGEEHRIQLKNMVEEKQARENKLTIMREDRGLLAQQLEEREKEARQERKKITEVRAQFHSAELKEARLETEMENGLTRLQEDYQLSYEEALLQKTEIPNRRVVTSRIQELKRSLADLGTVNLAAIEEYVRVKERYEFLSGQLTDMEEAKAALYKVINEMNQIMTIRFREAYEAINRNFTEVFTELFGGGRAHLQLTDGDNLLETGIDIIAQPPGKKLQHLSLLSGGERALTAIALLFAILKVKPSPFCVLDEIEASLDEANVTRFADYVKAFSEKSQFIVITHRKGTMQVADVLYGVTMDETGVSKLVSMKFSEAS
ncbi:MAG: chromosome segregation protein SMC [Thermincolia bacterium]